MSLSQKEKAQLQSKRIKKLKYKATGLFLYHPATDSWIPAQCDDEGRLVIDPADLDTRYHKKDEDLDLAANALKTTDLKLYQYDANTLYLRDHTKVYDKDLRLRYLYLTGGFYSLSTDLYFLARNAAGGNIKFRTLYGGSQTCARVESLGSNNGAFIVDRAGDITMLASKVFDGRAGEVDVEYGTVAQDPWGVPFISGNNGRTRIIYNSTLDETRIYVLSNGIWWYQALTKA